MGTGKAVIWIASGEQYIQEAIRSAESVKEHNDLPCILFHTGPILKTPFDTTIKLPERIHDLWYLDATHYLDIAIEVIEADRILLLDTDTFVLGSLDDFFTALDRFDIVGTHAIGRETMVQRDDIPASFPELHIGALAFRRNEKVRKLFKMWLDIYRGRPEYFGNNDQGPLREALWTYQGINLGILPPEYCFRYRWGGLVSGQVKVLHGRENNTPYEEIAARLKGGGIRVYARRELA